jgi:ABC-type polysaccharide/polyol phosphate transport system ATPase subunit
MSISDQRPAILFHGVWKSFIRHTGQMLIRDRLRQLLRPNAHETFHALREISFSIHPGESMAVIGPNGAGKSTLLNLTTNLCRPDRGSVKVNGRVAALLELGAGFHPDLTGAENVRINAALMGLSRRDVREKFDEIIAFSELKDFINEPLRTYSTGMAMRLAFSVAVSADPDILIVDEVLGVGDMSFQAKCLERIMQFRHAGKTILCVSHSNETLMGLCDRAMWLDHGRMMDHGPIARVVEAYRNAVSRQTMYSTG